MYHVPLAIVQQRLWSGSVNAQSDLRICWIHGHCARANITPYGMFLNMKTRLTGSWNTQNITITTEDTSLNYWTHFYCAWQSFRNLREPLPADNSEGPECHLSQFPVHGISLQRPRTEKKFCKKIKLIKTNSLSVFGCLIFYWKHGTQQCFKVR